MSYILKSYIAHLVCTPETVSENEQPLLGGDARVALLSGLWSARIVHHQATKAPQDREGQEFSWDAAAENLSRAEGAVLNPEAQYYSAFLWCLCALVVRLKCFGLAGAEARGADGVLGGVGHHNVLPSEGFRSGTPARNLPGHFQDQVKIPPGFD